MSETGSSRKPKQKAGLENDHTGKRKTLPILWVVFLDLLMAVFLFAVLILFSHFLPRIRTAKQVAELTSPVPAPASTPAAAAKKEAPENRIDPQTQLAEEVGTEEEPLKDETISEEVPVEEESISAENAVEEKNAAEEPVAGEPLDLREKFSEHFSDEVQLSYTSYQSPNISIEITKHEIREKSMVYYVADIYLADISCFATCFPESGLTGAAVSIMRTNKAILGINGDFCGYQSSGFFVRNGAVLRADRSSADICVMYPDGSIETYGPDDYQIEEILDKSPLQVWHFGPELLNADGTAKTEFNISPNIQIKNPRTALGYYEPGHYCFVVVDGRQPPYSSGVDMGGLAEIFESLQCRCAYNLDGGDSVYMILNGRYANHPSFQTMRVINDMLIIREAESPAEQEGA